MSKTDYRPKPPPARDVHAHKGVAGRVLCICGSAEMPGAAILTVRAAQRAGAGLVTLTIFNKEVLNVIPGASPETIYLDLTSTKDLYAGRLPQRIKQHDHHVRVAGPGLGVSGHTRELVRRLVSAEFSGPMVLDADALNVVGSALEVLNEYEGALVLTPHPGEAARMLEREVPREDAGRIECALEIQDRSGALCILKGRHTVVTDGERTYVCEAGNPGMATAGSGDVLSGILGAYLAVSSVAKDPTWTTFDAAAAAVRAHAHAGDLALRERGVLGLIASDLIAFLPAAQLDLDRID